MIRETGREEEREVEKHQCTSMYERYTFSSGGRWREMASPTPGPLLASEQNNVKGGETDCERKEIA